MKRRIIALATVTVLTLALSACGATEESNSSTPTVEQSSQTVTVEPTEVPTEAPTQAPTEAPEVTVEPTEAPVEPTEASSVNVAEDPNFEVIKNMVVEMMTVDYTNYKYAEFASIIETMDESRYEVTAVDSLDPILKDGLSDDEKKTAVENFLGLVEFEKHKIKVVEDGEEFNMKVGTTPTGEFYVMTLTDNVTGETIAWGLRVHLEATDNPGTYYVKEWGPEGFIQAGSVAEVPVADFYKIAE